MTPVHLFNVVSQHNRWLALRQATIAGNVANANTPGYKAADVAPFEAALETARLGMRTSASGHMMPGGGAAAAADIRPEQPWDVTHSGNSVSLEQEMLKAGEVNRAYRLNTSVLKAFQRMLLASAKV